ncbi:hypothetical protein LguiA_034736 [Lonicera macranthoides]
MREMLQRFANSSILDRMEEVIKSVDPTQEQEVGNVHNAASGGNMEASGTDKDGEDYNGRTALQYACWHGEVECIKVLLDARAEVDLLDMNNKNTLLHYAAAFGGRESVELMLENGALVTLKNLDGMTPVDLAKFNNQHEVLE